jgi:hypothetical protein
LAFSSLKASARSRSSHCGRSRAICPTGLPKVLEPTSAMPVGRYGTMPLITISLADAVLRVPMNAILVGAIDSASGSNRIVSLSAGLESRNVT